MSTDSAVQHITTAYAKDGKSVFHEFQHKQKTITGPYGSSTHVYVAPALLPDVSVGAAADLDATASHSQTGLANMKGRIIVDGGMASVILVVNPGVVVPFHRTRTVDTGVVLSGEVELHLDNGDKRTLKEGDTFTLRGAMHKWANVSDKEVRMFGVTVDTQSILDADGKVLKEEFAEPFL